MTGIRFEWDERKNLLSRQKHGVSFEQAAQVFRDPFHVSVQDRTVDGENRWQTSGFVDGAPLLMVAHPMQLSETAPVIRIISARQATRRERRRFEDKDGELYA